MQAKTTLWGLLPDGRCEAQLQRFRRTANSRIASTNGGNCLFSSVPVMLQLGRVHTFSPPAPQLRRIGLPQLRPSSLQVSDGEVSLVLPAKPITVIQKQMEELIDGFEKTNLPQLVFGRWIESSTPDVVATVQAMWPELQNSLDVLGGFQLCCGTLLYNRRKNTCEYSWQLHFTAPLRRPRIFTANNL